MQLSIKLHDDIPKVSKTWFFTYHPHYKNKLIGNQIQTFVCIANYFYYGYSFNSLGNLLTIFLLAYDSKGCTTKLGQVTKKGKPPSTSLHLFFDIF